MTTCAFVACTEVVECCLVGGCVNQRFQRHDFQPTTRREAEGVKASAPIEAGTKAKAGRDPKWTPRKRKAITR
jgi:hypothetical protein